MDTIRYYLALAILAMVPPSILFWFSIHPFIAFWRRLGTPFTLAIHYAALILVAALILLFGRPLLSVEFGNSPIAIGLAILFLVVAGLLRRSFSKQLRLSILLGVPELANQVSNAEKGRRSLS